MLETGLLALTKEQGNMRDVERVVCVSMQLLDSKFLGYWVLETVLLALTKEQVMMRDVGRVVLCVHAVVGQQVFGLLGVGDSAVGLDQGGGEYE